MTETGGSGGTVTRVRLPSGELRLALHGGPPPVAGRDGAVPDGTAGRAWPLERLLGFGVRRNPKRGYLLVSRVLGKHVPVSPLTVREAHRALAAQLPQGLPGPVLVVGLAETATALGEGVAREWARLSCRDDVTYLHTTRYHLRSPLALEFQEPHSHASGHLLYRPVRERDARHFGQAGTLVLVDDELSTGTTLENLACAYRALNPALREVVLVSLTDLCPRHAQVQAAVGVPVRSVSLLSGALEFEADAAYRPPVLPPVVGDGGDRTDLLAPRGARTGEDVSDSPLLSEALAGLLGLPVGARVLVLGTGEFQYLPFLLALRVQEARPDLVVRHSATTRSPVTVWGEIGSALEFTDNYRDGIPNFVYNVTAGAFDHILVGYEGHAHPDPALLDALNATAVRLA